MTTDTTTRRAVPEGWPPNTPVEVMKVARPVVIVGILGTLAIVGSVALSTWLIHGDLVSIGETLAKRKP